MKILPELTPQEAVEVVAQQRREHRYIGSERHIPGLILWEYDTTTGELRRCDVKREVSITIDKRYDVKSKVTARLFCLYVQAVNERRAMRKVLSLLQSKNIRVNLLKPRYDGREQNNNEGR